jgi:hypothetical protein
MRAVLCLALLGLFWIIPAVAAPVFPPGSRIGLVPADDMEFSWRSGLFENPSKYASVRMAEMRPEDYPIIERSIMNPDEAVFRVIFRERTTIGGYPAVLATVNQRSRGGFLLRKWLLAVREPTLTMYIVVQSIESPEGYTDAAIRRMLNSVVSRPIVPIEAEMAVLPFQIGDRAGFRPVRMDVHQLVMTEGLSDDLHLFEQPVMTASFVSMRPPNSAETQDFAVKLLRADPGLKGVAIEQTQPFQPRGRARHEIVARAKDAASGKPLIVLQTLEFDLNGILRIKSVTRPGDRETHLPRFRTLANGIEMKP